MPQEAQVLIMLKCIICLIPSGHRGRNAVPKTNKSFLVALLERSPFTSQSHSGAFGGQAHKQVRAGPMTRMYGVRVLGGSCPGMESSGACQGCALLSSQATHGSTELQR